MWVLSTNRSFFRALDLIHTGNRSFLIASIHNVKNFLVSLLELFLVVPSIAYLISNIKNLFKATESMYVISSFGISFGMYCFFVTNKRGLDQLFGDLQNIVDESKKQIDFEN